MTDPAGRPQLAGGRVPLWRDDGRVQFGTDPAHAVVVDGLSPALATLVRRLDGRRTTAELTTAAAADGAATAEVTALLGRLAAAGVVEDAGRAGQLPAALADDLAAWRLRSGQAAGDLFTRRAGATVEVHGNGRLAVAVTALLAASGVGQVQPRCTGRVTAPEVGTGYREQDVGLRRRQAALAVIDRHRVRSVPVHDDPLVDVAVLADTASHDVTLTARLVAARVPHLAAQAGEGAVVVGPLVLPGRTSCLRCAGLHRAEHDPAWPALATQLAGRPVPTPLAAATVAAGMAVEQVLGLLAGRGEPAAEPALAGTTVELDLHLGRVTRRRWPAHPGCGCGADRLPVGWQPPGRAGSSGTPAGAEGPEFRV